MPDMILNIREDKSSWDRMKTLLEKLTEREQIFIFAYTQGLLSGIAHEKCAANVHDQNQSA